MTRTSIGFDKAAPRIADSGTGINVAAASHRGTQTSWTATRRGWPK
ncbi:hypothetical protein [Rubripirellula reticaptiva]|nr:hypothetical protein [Rubripirellula reticaptiva]